MNERIREIARRVVGKNKNDVGSISLFDEQIEHFAELLISAVTAEVKDEVQYQCGWANAEIVENRIKHVFGV
jgi:superfamily I DNA and/or RNA helicase